MNQYELLDSGNFKKYEKVGDWKIVRPAPAAVWRPKLSSWSPVDLEFLRFENGKGKWEYKKNREFEALPVDVGILKFWLEPTSFGHLGVFAEQMSSWEYIHSTLSKKPGAKVLNLFAYTGGSSLAALKAKAEVVHLDASKTSVDWAKENAELNGLAQEKVRWMVDDAPSFVKREVRRGNKYDAIILDPPTYGLGNKKQVWKIDDHLLPILDDLKQLISNDFQFMLLSSHSPGHTPKALENLMRSVYGDGFEYEGQEMQIPSAKSSSLPAGSIVKMTK